MWPSPLPQTAQHSSRDMVRYMDPVGIGIAIVAVVTSSVFVLYRNRVDGTFRTVENTTRGDKADRTEEDVSSVHSATSEWQELSHLVKEPVAEPAFIQFSGEYCAQCKRNQALFKRLNQSRNDFRFYEVPVEEHSALAGQLKIRRTPTIFLLDPVSETVTRTEGAVALRELGQTLDSLIGRTS